MIVFDLKCEPNGHVFEAWFGSSADYDSQRSRGLVECPVCGAGELGKAVMAPRLAAKTDLERDPQSAKAALAALAAAQKKLLADSHYVGERFADEARAIYLGEADARSIYGKATPVETRSLREEGINVATLPFPVVPRGEEN